MEIESVDIDSAFKNFAGGASEINGKQFAKMSKDTKILDKKLTSTDIDLTFAKYMNKTTKKMGLSKFKESIEAMAKKKGITSEALTEKIAKSGGPSYSGTTAEKVRFHDDKSAYTGVYKHGGPTNLDVGGFWGQK